MINRRMVMLIGITAILIIARVWVSWNNGDVPSRLFGIGQSELDLNPAEQKKMNILSQHPALYSQKDEEQKAGKTNKEQRNPFIFGLPPRPTRIMAPPILKPPTVIVDEEVQKKKELESRFSGKLFGMTEFPQSGVKTVLLSTHQETLLLKEGELIDNRYQITTINKEHVIIKDQKSGLELVLPFEDKP